MMLVVKIVKKDEREIAVKSAKGHFNRLRCRLRKKAEKELVR